jgi:hypothetical protein
MFVFRQLARQRSNHNGGSSNSVDTISPRPLAFSSSRSALSKAKRQSADPMLRPIHPLLPSDCQVLFRHAVCCLLTPAPLDSCSPPRVLLQGGGHCSCITRSAHPRASLINERLQEMQILRSGMIYGPLVLRQIVGSQEEEQAAFS